MSAVQLMDFDESTAFLGDYGFFHVLMIVLLSLSAMPCGYMRVIVVFVSDTPEYHCKLSINSTRNGTDVERASSWSEPNSCSRDKVNGNGTETWDLVCENAWKVPFSTSLYFVGVLIGSFISGHLSDRFGRKPVFFVTMFLQAAIALIQATSISWVMYCILNCMRGASHMSNYTSSIVLGSEMLSKSARVSYTLLGHSMGYGLGYALLPLLAYFIRGWRMLLVASAIPSLLFIPSWWVIPESPRWLLQKGRVEEAERVIRNAAKQNRVPAPEIIFRTEECLELMQKKDEKEQTYTYMDLFRTPNMRNVTILGLFLWVSVAMVFYGLSLNTSNLYGNVYLNCFLSALIDIGAYFTTWLMVNRAPRPTVLFSALMSCGILLLVIQLVPEDMPVMFQVLALVGKMGMSGAYSFIYVIFTELMPTVVRNMGFGIFTTAANIGTIISPYVIYSGVHSKILPYIIFGTISIVAAAVSILLPDTRNNKLPDHISQAKPIRNFSCQKKTPSPQSTETEGCKKEEQ
ncbi:solute carrier family 22 member 4-like isoform X2 [Notolabrus celidotus]|uniref:solute carrier family 22 member 4-like isoform X2 n=1 Tax=Notolabrus celidotus TaxID=1203425 RepID=UPI0014900D75|nr:solute carrier family 22 member 4-like isoform X2 [Notolabrus celidotus]